MNALSIFFPGVWVHEFSHAIACALGGVKIHRINVRSSSGMVVHDSTNARNAWMIALAPLGIGTLLSALCIHSAKNAWDSSLVLALLLGWLGISIGFHAIPSTTDALNIPQAISRRFGEMINSQTNLGTKVTKLTGYILTWPIAAVVAAIIWGSNLTILFRVGWVVGAIILA